MLNINKEQLQAAFEKTIQTQVTTMLREATISTDIKKLLHDAFRKSWRNEKDNWIEKEAKDSMSHAMYTAVRTAIDETGIKDTIKTIAEEHMKTDEFKENLYRRVIETIKGTTFYVKPEEEEES